MHSFIMCFIGFLRSPELMLIREITTLRKKFHVYVHT